LSFKCIFVSLLSFFSVACTTCQAANFISRPIPDEIFNVMKRCSYKDCTLKDLKDKLRYLTLSYLDFDGKEQEGHLICNEKIAEKLCNIFEKLFNSKYQISKMQIIDHYFDDEDVKSNKISVDEASMRDNNTSCFMWRTIRNTGKPSLHGLGLAVDINPLQNPCISHDNGKELIEPATSNYADRNISGPHMIDKKDYCYKLFSENGFEWGGNWIPEEGVVDYQHFQYPIS
jgi:hypothetical protein